MANVLHPHIDFHPRPVAHAPSPFGFGFGLGPSTSTSMMTSTGWGTSTPGHTNPAAFQQLASSVTQSASSRPQKRRMSPEDDSEQGRYSAASTSRDESMDRSPTPERPKLAAPKRARVANANSSNSKTHASTKENKGHDSPRDDDIDIGVLLANLPPQSLLPLLLSLLKEQPTLKDIILPLIPHPTLEVAIQTLAKSAKKLNEAIPYSNTPTYTPMSAFGSARTPGHSPFGHPPQAPHSHMRNEYILSRLQPHIADYVSICLSYFPYFSCISSPTRNSTPGTGRTNANPQLQAIHKDKFLPGETFLFLQAVTSHILSQHSLAQAELLKLILPRLSEEWAAWVTRLDEHVNGQSRMFGSETLKSWDRGLNELVAARNPEIASMAKVVRDKWVARLGWLWNKQLSAPAQQAMDEH